MEACLVYPAGTTAACHYAAGFLEKSGVETIDHPSPEVTCLLLDVPSFDAGGKLRSGEDVENVLRMLPPGITVVGGNLNHPALETYRKLDLLLKDQYLAANAAITAECAVQVAMQRMSATFADSPALVIGWGRIAKCLGQLLRFLGCPVTVGARKEADRAMASALGYGAVDSAHPEPILSKFRLIFNTAPEPVLSREQLERCRDCLKIDLASRPGLDGEDVLWARGLPGKYAPETSGRLIAQVLLDSWKEERA